MRQILSTHNTVRLLSIIFIFDAVLRWLYWGDYAYAVNTYRGPYNAIVVAAVPLFLSMLAALVVLIRPITAWLWPIPFFLIYFCIGYTGLDPDNSTDKLPNAIQIGWTSVVLMAFVWLAWFLRRVSIEQVAKKLA